MKIYALVIRAVICNTLTIRTVQDFQNFFKSEWHFISEWNLNFEIQVQFDTACNGRDKEVGPIAVHYIFLCLVATEHDIFEIEKIG